MPKTRSATHFHSLEESMETTTWPMPLVADPERRDLETGIFVRAMDPTTQSFGDWDISQLTRNSLQRWLRSRGGANPFAENTVLILMGYPPQ